MMDEDTAYEETTIVEVDRHDDTYSIKRADGWSISFKAVEGVPVEVGMKARFYGRGIGYAVRGITVNGLTLFYRTEEEEQQRHREWCDEENQKKQAELDATREDRDRRWSALPQVFQDRFKRFDEGNPLFRRDFESYELFVCEQAFAMALAMPSTELLREFNDASFDRQREMFSAMADGHSGNTFGCAVRLANWYLHHPEVVAKEHGALTPLVGCKAYGCTHSQ